MITGQIDQTTTILMLDYIVIIIITTIAILIMGQIAQTIILVIVHSRFPDCFQKLK